MAQERGFYSSYLCLLLISVTATGCSNSSTAPPLARGGATAAYVVQNLSTVYQFSIAENGSIQPSAALSPPEGMQVFSIATDKAGGIYLGGVMNGQSQYAGVVQVYAPGATGSESPVRTIELSLAPYVLAVDSANRLYVAGDDSVAVYAAHAQGSQTAIRTLDGTGIANGLAVDDLGQIYVSSGEGFIEVYSPTASGTIAPTRYLSSQNGFTGIAVDKVGNMYTSKVNPKEGATVLVFGPSATGDSAPNRSWTLDADEQSSFGFSIDSAGNVFLLSSTTSSEGEGYPLLLGFGPSASGNSKPAVLISSPSWTASGGNIAVR